MVKLLHTADVHLGKPFRRLGERGSRQTKFVEESFKNLCALAKKEQVDVVLIAGDLFDANVVREPLVKMVAKELDALGEAGIHTVITAGTHDRMEADSILFHDAFSSVKNIHILTPDENQVDFENLGLVVCGTSNVYNKSTESPLAKLKPLEERKYSVAMVHASVAIEGKHAPDDYPITIEEIEKSPFDYVAFGHWHRAQEIVPSKAWYSGSPETLSLQEEGAGKALIVELEDEVTITPHQVGQVHFDSLEIDVDRTVDDAELISQITKDTDDQLIRTVTIVGMLEASQFLDTAALKEQAEEQFFALKIHDKTGVVLDDQALQAFPDELVIGQFVRILKEEIDAEEDEAKKKRLEKSLQLGVALLLGREVL